MHPLTANLHVAGYDVGGAASRRSERVSVHGSISYFAAIAPMVADFLQAVAERRIAGHL
jgi:hypothetical protein